MNSVWHNQNHNHSRETRNDSNETRRVSRETRLISRETRCVSREGGNLHLSGSVSGFLKGHSCAAALLKMTDNFRASLDNKVHCIAIAVDLSKAFDSISHSLLISTLKAYGFTESAVNLIRSYLHDRLQRVINTS